MKLVNADELRKQLVEVETYTDDGECYVGMFLTDNDLLSAPPVDIFDRIKKKIMDEAEFAYADFDQYKVDVLEVEADELPDDDFRYGLERAIEIINSCIREEDK